MAFQLIAIKAEQWTDLINTLKALATIAENTKPKDANIEEVSVERDRHRETSAGLARILIKCSKELDEAMEDPDLLSRATRIRQCSQQMATFGLRIEASLRGENG